jgi:hypothetical protein
MSRHTPESDCYDLAFQAGYPLPEPAEVALEDYARVLTRSRSAEAIRAEDDPSVVTGVHVCGLGAPLRQTVLTDLEDFARDMAVRGARGGPGWS